MTKILFLDFDGPLTNMRSFLAYDKPLDRIIWTTADPVAIEMLNNLYDKHKYLTVISSTWRHLSCLSPTEMSAEDSLRHWGFRGEFHEDIYTPRGLDREIEIEMWLRNHSDIEIFTSLDDIKLDENLNPVTVNPYDGLTYQNYRELDAYLSGIHPDEITSSFIL